MNMQHIPSQKDFVANPISMVDCHDVAVGNAIQLLAHKRCIQKPFAEMMACNGTHQEMAERLARNAMGQVIGS